MDKTSISSQKHFNSSAHSSTTSQVTYHVSPLCGLWCFLSPLLLTSHEANELQLNLLGLV